MEHIVETGASISIEEFKRLVQSLGPEQLASIPIEKLPEVIPEEVLELASPEARSIIQDFIFELNTREIHLQMALAEHFIPDIVDALNLSKNFNQLPFHDLFKARVSELLLLYKRWEKSRDSRQRQWLIPKIREIDKIVPEFRLESKILMRAYLLLEDNLTKAGDFREKFITAIAALKRNENEIEKILGRYFHLRLAVIGNEMLSLEVKVRDAEAVAVGLQKKIDVLHAELTRLKVGTFFMRDTAQRDMADKLKMDICRLSEEKRAVEVLISETDLLGWLDVIVDASLSAFHSAGGDNVLRKVRSSLYRLLSQYCEHQERGALQIAKNPFLQIDPKKTIKFLLRSEQFILDYFAQRRNQMVSWLGDAAESKVSKLREVERDLLKELKRNTRLKK